MPRDDGRHNVAVRDVSGGGPDFSGMLAELLVGVGQVKQQTAPGPRIPWEACHPVPILGQISLTSGAGTLDYPDLYGPKDPYYWDVRALAVWGFTAGTVTVYVNSTSGQEIGQATTAGMFTWSSQVILAPRDRLIFGATGITGTVSVQGSAIEIATAWLPEYLM